MSKEPYGVSCGENWSYDFCCLRTQQFHNLSPNFHLAWNRVPLQRYHSSSGKRNAEKITVEGHLSAAGRPQRNKCLLQDRRRAMKHRSTSRGSKVYLMSWDGGRQAPAIHSLLVCAELSSNHCVSVVTAHWFKRAAAAPRYFWEEEDVKQGCAVSL